MEKDKQSSGCAMCKPHKHGWGHLNMEKVRNRIQLVIKGEQNEI